MSTTCDRVDDQLSAYRDGELSRLRQWQVAAHLRHCERCAGAVVEIGDVDSQLRHALLATESPAYLTAAVMRRLPAMPPARRRRSPGARWIVGAGCVVLQAVSLWGAYRAGGQRGEARIASPASRPHTGLFRPAPARQAAAVQPAVRWGGRHPSRPGAALLSSVR